MVEGLVDGTIDAIVTDHAPHTIEEKTVNFPWLRAALRVGTYTRYSTYLLVYTGTVDLMTLIRTMTSSPAALLGVDAGNVGGRKNGGLDYYGLK